MLFYVIWIIANFEKSNEVSDKENNVETQVGYRSTIYVLLPVAGLVFVLFKQNIFTKLLLQLDRRCLSVFCPSLSKRDKLLKWATNRLPLTWSSHTKTLSGGIADLWSDGSLLCTLINTAVSGACPNPHRHWKKPPSHAQAIAYKYLGVVPMFTEEDLAGGLTANMERKFLIYFTELQQSISELNDRNESIRDFSTCYIPRGMGLFSGEQYRKVVFYVYLDTKNANVDTQANSSVIIEIRGPYGTYGQAVIPRFQRNLVKFPEINVISDLLNSTPDSKSKSIIEKFPFIFTKYHQKHLGDNITIDVIMETDRARITYIPKNYGMYEINMIANGELLTGCPYNVHIFNNSSGIEETFENDDETVRRPKYKRRKVLSKTIDFIDENLSLTELNTHSASNIEEKIEVNIPKSSSFNFKAVLEEITKRDISELLAQDEKADKKEYTVIENSGTNLAKFNNEDYNFSPIIEEDEREHVKTIHTSINQESIPEKHNLESVTEHEEFKVTNIKNETNSQTIEDKFDGKPHNPICNRILEFEKKSFVMETENSSPKKDKVSRNEPAYQENLQEKDTGFDEDTILFILNNNSDCENISETEIALIPPLSRSPSLFNGYCGLSGSNIEKINLEPNSYEYCTDNYSLDSKNEKPSATVTIDLNRNNVQDFFQATNTDKTTKQIISNEAIKKQKRDDEDQWREEQRYIYKQVPITNNNNIISTQEVIKSSRPSLLNKHLNESIFNRGDKQEIEKNFILQEKVKVKKLKIPDTFLENNVNGKSLKDVMNTSNRENIHNKNVKTLHMIISSSDAMIQHFEQAAEDQWRYKIPKRFTPTNNPLTKDKPKSPIPYSNNNNSTSPICPDHIEPEVEYKEMSVAEKRKIFSHNATPTVRNSWSSSSESENRDVTSVICSATNPYKFHDLNVMNVLHSLKEPQCPEKNESFSLSSTMSMPNISLDTQYISSNLVKYKTQFWESLSSMSSLNSTNTASMSPNKFPCSPDKNTKIINSLERDKLIWKKPNDCEKAPIRHYQDISETKTADIHKSADDILSMNDNYVFKENKKQYKSVDTSLDQCSVMTIEERKRLLLKQNYEKETVISGRTIDTMVMNQKGEKDNEMKPTHAASDNNSKKSVNAVSSRTCVMLEESENNPPKKADVECLANKNQFKRAVNFFKNLEKQTSKSNKSKLRTTEKKCRRLSLDMHKNKIKEKKVGGSLNLSNISDRFSIDNLYNDVIGNNTGSFKGTPNRKALLEALAKFTQTKPRLYSSTDTNDEDIEFDLFRKRAKIRKRKSIKSVFNVFY